MKKYIVPIFLFWTLHLAAQQSNIQLERTLQWGNTPKTMTAPGGETLEVWEFTDCSHSSLAPTLPLFNERFALSTAADLEVGVSNVEWEPISLKEAAGNTVIQNDLAPTVTLEQERFSFFGRVNMHPLRRTSSGGYERARKFTLDIRVKPIATPAPTIVNDRNVVNSKLSDGDIYKFGVNQTAVYKLTYDFLKNKLGISNLDNIDPRNIQLLGNGGIMLSEKTNDPYPDDLLENAVFVSGENDGKFDVGDFILCYAVGPQSTIITTPNNPQLTIANHLYDRNAAYFIKIGAEKGQRIELKPELQPAPETVVSDQFNDVGRIEQELFNLLAWSPVHQGSGKRWLGDLFEQSRQKEYKLNFPNIIKETSTIKMEFAGRCDGVATTARLTADGTVFTGNMTGTDNDNNNAMIASSISVGGNFVPKNDEIALKVEYINASRPSSGWVDYIEIDARRRLVMVDKMMSFRDLKSRLNKSTRFKMEVPTGSNLTIWDITQFDQPGNQPFTAEGNQVSFVANTDSVIRTYIAFYGDANFPLPESISGKITNQNLHALESEELVIIYHPDFEASAQQLAEHRRSFSQLKVAAININLLYNEFSGGTKDPTAIRNFARFMLARNPQGFKYLLLFGDGSFDPKNNSKAAVNNDFIPVWETTTPG